MIRCLIVDDEPIAIRVLQAHLGKIPDVVVVAACTNALEALHVVRSDAVDLVFLDIEMPELTGIGFVEALERPPRFVFTTAHRDYALQGFELDAVDYLLKPIGLPRLLRAVEKYRLLQRPAHEGGAPEADDPGGQVLTLRVDRRTVRVDLADVLYVESLSDYITVHTAGHAYTSKLRISDLEAQLEPHGFVRVHRSFLVAVRHADAFTAKEVQVAGQVLPISRTYRQHALARLRSGGA
jgi:two-component system LytT family response regulator